MHSIRAFINDIEPGRYRLTISVEADSGAIRNTFELNWFGGLETLSLENISDRLIG